MTLQILPFRSPKFLWEHSCYCTHHSSSIGTLSTCTENLYGIILYIRPQARRIQKPTTKIEIWFCTNYVYCIRKILSEFWWQDFKPHIHISCTQLIANADHATGYENLQKYWHTVLPWCWKIFTEKSQSSVFSLYLNVIWCIWLV